jgi:DnaA family protein
VVQQLTFDLAPPEAPALANFLGGDNAEALDALGRMARGLLRETSVVLWGEPGAGKSHLLQAAVGEAAAASRYARYYASPELAPAEPPELGALVAVDDVGRASADAQANLFRLYLALAGTGGQLLAAMARAPATCDLRADLRTRLGQGLVYEVRALRDEAKPAALARFAAARGFALPADVIDYLLAHYPRDMASLVRAVVALDRRSLASKRPITIPFVREALGGEV